MPKKKRGWECHYFRARVVDDICQSPKKDPICVGCKYNPKKNQL